MLLIIIHDGRDQTVNRSVMSIKSADRDFVGFYLVTYEMIHSELQPGYTRYRDIHEVLATFNTGKSELIHESFRLYLNKIK